MTKYEDLVNGLNKDYKDFLDEHNMSAEECVMRATDIVSGGAVSLIERKEAEIEYYRSRLNVLNSQIDVIEVERDLLNERIETRESEIKEIKKELEKEGIFYG